MRFHTEAHFPFTPFRLPADSFFSLLCQRFSVVAFRLLNGSALPASGEKD
jgi:hypothetical protein